MGLTSRLQRQPGSKVPFMKVAAPALPTTAWPCALNCRFSPSRARLLMNACVMPPPLPVARAPDASGRRDPDTAGSARLVDETDRFGGGRAQVSGSDAMEKTGSRGAVSLNRRTVHPVGPELAEEKPVGIATICEMDALSAPVKLNVGAPVASDMHCPI